MKEKITQLLCVLLLMLEGSSAYALTFKLPANGDNIVGKLQHIESLPGDNFTRIGRRYDIGYYEMIEANPGIDPDSILPTGTPLIIPTRFTLPAAPRIGIVMNLAELRLYYYPAGGRTVVTYPVGIGREGWDTPLGVTRVYAKTKDPTWHVPESIREARAEEGVNLPKTVPPGPDNPLGGYALRLALPAYLIHGTNDASGVGRRSSSGCIRTMSEDIENLFEIVPVNTPVRIINDAYKIGWEHDRLYLEAHLPLPEQRKEEGNTVAPAMELVVEAITHKPTEVDWRLAQETARIQAGYPVMIGVVKKNTGHAHSNS